MTQLQIPQQQVEDSNSSANPHFDTLLQARLSRRSVLGGGAGMTAAMMFGTLGLVGCGSDSDDGASGGNTTPPVNNSTALPKKLTFKPVEHSKEDRVIVPEGYQVQIIAPTGTPLFSGVSEWSDNGLQSGESFEKRVGDNHDGMCFYGLKDDKYSSTSSDRGLLAINHEYVVTWMINPLGAYTITNPSPEAVGTIYAKTRLASDIRREVNAHGVAIIEIRRKANSNEVEIVKDSKFNRRITSTTLMDLTGPAAGSDLMKTKFDPQGLTTRGMNNNCGSNYSPWGTYLTTEENFNGVFARGNDAALLTPALEAARRRYGASPNSTGFGYLWHTGADSDAKIPDEFKRWDMTVTGAAAAEDYRYAFNTFGYIVEIDPFSPNSRPAKRTALGRFAHETCSYAPLVEGQPVVFYMGDDARNEYIYKFVSKAVWDAKDKNGGLAAGSKYLDQGTLYVAKFNADGSGEWVELTHGKNGLDSNNSKYPFASQADVVIYARLAADSVGATKMDRPEWTSVSPVTGEVYVTLTNNSTRGIKSKDAEGKDVVLNPTDAANPRVYDGTGDGVADGNRNGHVIRWREAGNKHTALSFNWDVYVFGAAYNTPENLSGLTSLNDMSSPDGLGFDDRGMLWIQTDDGAYTNTTNCMMLAALPGKVGDGASTSVGGVTTYMGAKPTETNLARFLVGPVQCEITGIAFTPDFKTMFVNVQHPGEDGTRAAQTSNWPASQTNPFARALPRSATVVITRKDGGVIAAE
jgi:secreted PhoX family phosphatase